MLRLSSCCLGMLAVLAGAPAGAISAGQIDTFQDGTVASWGGGAGPTNVATGGPAGAGDRFLRISTTGGNLGTVNSAQWAGNYVAAGVTSLRLTLENQGPSALALRLTIFGPAFFTAYTSVDEFVLAPESGWVTVDFALTQDALVRTRGTGTFDATLAGVTRLLLRHDPDPLSPPGEGNPVTGALGVDDITAVPEPGTGPLVIAGLAALSRAPRARTGS